MEDKSTLISELKTLIIESLQLDDVAPEDIGPDDPLVRQRPGTGIPSTRWSWLWALEKAYGIVIPDEDVGKEAFASLSALADFVAKERKRRKPRIADRCVYDPSHITRVIPHRPPFLLIDAVESVEFRRAGGRRVDPR